MSTTPHLVLTGDHEEWGKIFGPYHCDGNLPRQYFDNPSTADSDWRRFKRNGYPGIPALPEFDIIKEQA